MQWDKAYAAAGEENGFTVLFSRSAESSHFLPALLPDPDELLSRGDIVKPGTRTHAGTVRIGAGSYFLKRYNNRGPAYSLRNAFRISRALRTWRVTWEFLARGVPVPEPLVLLEERRFRLLGRAYILMEFVDGARKLRSCWQELNPAAQEELLVRLADVIGKMHRAGCLHGDLKWDNILIGGKERPSKVFLVDLDGSLVQQTLSRRRMEKDIDRFLRDLRDGSPEPRLRSLFLNSWRSWIDDIE